MTERELDRLLRRGVLRVRMNAALSWACVSLGLALAGGALLVGMARFWPVWAGPVLSAYWAPPVLMAGAALLGLWRSRPPINRVALELDRRAGLAEHLTTWDDYRRRPAPGDAVLGAFIAAQRQATLIRAKDLRPARHLPLRLPSWSRVLWLALLALGGALLAPPRKYSAPAGAALFAAQKRNGVSGGAPGPGGLRALSHSGAESFKINPLTPTELHQWKIEALADARVTLEQKAEILAKLEAKIGDLPESELSDEVRGLLDELRRQTGQAKPGATAPQGSRRVEGQAGEPESSPKRGPNGAGEALEAALSAEQLAGIARERYPDVGAELERYYRAAVSKGAPAVPAKSP